MPETINKFDVVIVGGGPSGSLAGFHAARQGLSVLILDKSSFPRHKPCAGGLTPKSLLRIPFSIDEVVEDRTRNVSVSLNFRKPADFRSEGTLCTFVVREKFDALLLNTALSEGCRFQKISRLKSVSPGAESVVVGFDDDIVEARYVIAADGANSTVRRMTRQDDTPRRAFAIEGLVQKSALKSSEGMALDFGVVKHGYGWAFPKADHINIGLFVSDDQVKLSKAQLLSYAKTKLGVDDVDHICGFPIPFGGQRISHTDRRILFVGDAAGFAEPLLGEGLHNALFSGDVCGRAVAEALRNQGSAVEKYENALAPLKADIQLSERIAFRYFYPFLDNVGYRTLTFPLVKRAAVGGLAAGKTLAESFSWFSGVKRHSPASISSRANTNH